jgi:thiol-disulfide isomerase/thioredoxin
LKFLDKVTNIAVLVAVVVFLGVTVKSQIDKRAAFPVSVAQNDGSPTSLVGKTISLPSLSYPLKNKTLVMFISTTCHFCKASEPFYQQLALKAPGKFDLVAVLPQPQDQANAYLKSSAISASTVISTSLSSAGVSATPTLLLLNPVGKVEKAWIGLLDEHGQKSVLEAVMQ